jgi:ABC-type glutathione transport system ATPase component
MVIVTHDIDFAIVVADRVVFMADGVIVESGPAQQVIDNPTCERTKAFLAGGAGTTDSLERRSALYGSAADQLLKSQI